MKNNKYKNDISKIEIANDMKKKILSKVSKSKEINYKYIFASIFLSLIVCIGVVNASTIKDKILNIKGTTYKYSSGEEITTPSINSLKTNYDDFVMKIDCDIKDESCINYNSKEHVLIDDAKKDIGVNFLQLANVHNYKVNYYLSDNNESNNPGRIIIETDEESTYKIDDKEISLRAVIYTSNYYDSNKEIELNYDYEGEVTLDNEIKGYIDSYKFRDEKRSYLYFVKDNIEYTLTGFNNVTNEELINIANTLK